MDLPVTDSGLDQKHEISKEGVPAFQCNLCDLEVLHKLGDILLPGLATACVDNTSGDLFKGPGSVAVDIRKEMVEYITQRSETFVAESLIEDGSPYVPTSDDPIDIIADFIDDFANTKQNLFSRVSGWLLSEKREDKIDDFVQEMELSSFWDMERRLALSETLLKNVDLEGKFHCTTKFDTEEDRNKHLSVCDYRSMDCTHEGCRASFCAMHLENHDSICPFKILPCEQKCSANITRREMDRHCITVCPMKLVNCPFYHVGCQSSIPYCTTEQHCSEFLHSHLLYILRTIHKGAHVEDLKYRVEQLQQSSFADQFSEAKDVRSLTRVVKNLDAKLGPLEHHRASTGSDKQTDSVDAPADEAVENRVESSQEPLVTSENPEMTTKNREVSPEVTTEDREASPEVITKDPEVTTKDPEVSPEVTTKNPEVTTEDREASPEVTTKNPEVAAKDAEVSPEVTTENPVVSPEVTTKNPEVAAKDAEVSLEVTTENPVVSPEVTTKDPEVSPEVTTKSPEVTTKNPETESEI